MDRVRQGTVATAGIVFYLDGVSTAPTGNAATVTITRADGTEIVTDASAAHGTAGEFSYTLTAAETVLLDSLTLDWTATFAVGGAQTLTTKVEVVGGHLFSVADARADKTLSNADKYSVGQIVEARTMAEQALERACGVAFVPRYARERTYGFGAYLDSLRWPLVRSLREVDLDGTPVTDLSTVGINRSWLYYSRGWSTIGWQAPVTIGYEHGHDEPDGEVSRACLRLAKHYLVDSPQDDRALRIDTESGSMVISTPGMRGQRFGIPEVDAVVRAHAYAQPMVA